MWCIVAMDGKTAPRPGRRTTQLGPPDSSQPAAIGPECYRSEADMTAPTDAWVLHSGPLTKDAPQAVCATLSREDFQLPEVDDDEALVEPLFGSWEANIEHALSREPIDVCRARLESQVVLGNLGVVRVLRPAKTAPFSKEGDLCLVMPFAQRDRCGYAELIYAYDCPGTVGILAKRTNIKAELLLPIPEDTGYSLPQWAAYARYFTAWDNWRVAHRCWLSQMEGLDPANELIFGWGGGVVFAELLLAKRFGFRVAMTASTDGRLSYLAEQGICAVDRRLFQDLQYDDDAARHDREYSRRYRASEAQFIKMIDDLSDGAGVAIFLDNIGAPLYKATVKALARQGVLATVGWKQGMRESNLRAAECIKRHLHVNTHVWRFDDSPQIRDYQEATGWIPDIDPDAIYDFDHIPQLAEDYRTGRIDTYFPLFRVNEL
jgi:NADPH:quinone reductase-like Zn-dependent oxidoreductase